MNFLKSYFVNTTVDVDFLPITSDLKYAIRDSQAKEGLATITIPGAGAGVTILEPISEVIEELKVVIETYAGEGESRGKDKRKEEVYIAPRVLASLIGRSVSVPIRDSKLVLDPYEEVYLIDFDKKIRRREFFVHIITSDAAPAGAGKQVPKK